MPEKKLTDHEEVFVSAYLATLDIRKAAIAAKYADPHDGYEVFRKPYIRAEVKRRMTERLGELDITADRVLREIARIAFANPSDAVQVQTDASGAQIVRILDSDLWPAELHAAVASISQDKDFCIKVQWRDKHAALLALAKHLHMDAGTDDDGKTVKVFIVPAPAGSEEEWEQNAKQAQEESRRRAQEMIDDQQSG